MMAKKKEIPEYTTVTKKGHTYYKTSIMDADGKQITFYGKTCEEVYKKAEKGRKAVKELKFRRANPTVRDYSEKWLMMKSATVREHTLAVYRNNIEKHILPAIGDMYIDEVTADDLKMLMVPVSKLSSATYNNVNMLVKSIFKSALQSEVIKENPAVGICPRGGKPAKVRPALSDRQVRDLIEVTRDLPPYLVVLLGLFAGLRREEILGLKWDCVFLDEAVPYIAVRRAWRSENNRPSVTTVLKTPAARRDIPIPDILVTALKEQKEKSISDYVISDSEGEPLSCAQFQRMWHYIPARSTEERTIYRYINGECIRHTIKPELGERCRTKKSLVYTLDFSTSPHVLRHTYITNLIAAGVDPKTVQYLAGHENSKVTMDIYAKVKYNKPWELAKVVNAAFPDPDKNMESEL